MHGFKTPIFFLDSDSPCQDLLFPHSNKLYKNTAVLVGTILKPSVYVNKQGISLLLFFEMQVTITKEELTD